MVESAAARAIRLIDLVPYLHNHPGVSLKDVAAEFNVSIPELLKDLDLLFMCGLPGYTPLELIDLSVEDGIVSLREPQNLGAPRRFSQTEALVIRVALSALEDLLPPSKVEKVRALRKKFTRLFANEIPNDALYFEGDVERTKMNVLREAISSEKKLLISYFNPVKSEVTERKISVIKVATETNRTLIDAWCDSSHAVRTFNLANIRSISITADDATSNFSDLSTDSTYAASIRVSTKSDFYQKNQDQLVADRDKFTVNIFQSEWLIRSALSESGVLEVLSPKELRSEVLKRSKDALSQYQRLG